MKKIKKNDLRLDKEVISSLGENELENLKGGINYSDIANSCKQTQCCPSVACSGAACTELSRGCQATAVCYTQYCLEV